MVVFYHRNFDKNINKPVDVILSPQYYWIKKIEIPIKNIFEAKKIAKNIFDLDGEYIYDAVKLGDIYFAVAIEKNLKLKIDPKYIRSIRIAQAEFFKYDAVNIDDEYSLEKIDDILFCFPKNSSAPKLDQILNDIKLSSFKFNLYGIDLKRSDLIKLFTVFFLVVVSLGLNIFVLKKAINSLEKQKEQISKKYSLPKTKIQLESILSELKNIDFKQTLLRKDLEFLSKMPLNKEDKVKYISYNGNKISIEVQTKKDLKKFFQSRFKILSYKKKNDLIKAELTHE